MYTIHPTARLRPTPFQEATVAAGLTSASIYNRMVLPTSYGDPDAEYWRIMNAVSLWDVSAERQVQLQGPDAARLAQILSPRDLSTCALGQGKYVALCDHRGTIINDPILLKLSDDRFWLSIADSDIWSWARAIAAERKLDVDISEPDVSPLAVQGPHAEDLVASVCGDWVRDLRYFWFKETDINGIPVLLCRSGWSKQGGFELFLMDGTRGVELWNLMMEAGESWGIGPGAPTTAERTESGLVSVGGDTDSQTNPFEIRLDRFVDMDVDDDVIGIQALRRIHKEGPRRHQLGLRLEGREPAPLGFAWEAIEYQGTRIGSMTNCVWSPRFEQNIGYALISRDVPVDTEVEIVRPAGRTKARTCSIPFE